MQEEKLKRIINFMDEDIFLMISADEKTMDKYLKYKFMAEAIMNKKPDVHIHLNMNDSKEMDMQKAQIRNMFKELDLIDYPEKLLED